MCISLEYVHTLNLSGNLMKRYQTKYIILDDFGDVVRITLERPTKDSGYEYRVERVVVFDTKTIEECLF